MAIGERIRFIRNLRGMTQKYLGIMAGLPERTALRTSVWRSMKQEQERRRKI